MTATIPPHADTRACRLYRFRVYHPDDMRLPVEQRRVVLGYIGETIREPLARLLEHIFDQPWSDTIVGWDLDPRVFAGKAAVMEAERLAIEAERPLYNYEHNLGNPHRVEIWRAEERRRRRDATTDVQPWTHPQERGGRQQYSRPPARPAVQRQWKPWQRRLLGWGAGWLGSALAGWLAVVWYFDFAVWWYPAAGSAQAAAMLTCWAWLGFPITKKQRRRARRKLPRWLRSRS